MKKDTIKTSILALTLSLILSAWAYYSENAAETGSADALQYKASPAGALALLTGTGRPAAAAP